MVQHIRANRTDVLSSLDAPTRDIALIETAALDVLERFDHDRPVHLLGVRAEFERS